MLTYVKYNQQDELNKQNIPDYCSLLLHRLPGQAHSALVGGRIVEEILQIIQVECHEFIIFIFLAL